MLRAKLVVGCEVCVRTLETEQMLGAAHGAV